MKKHYKTPLVHCRLCDIHMDNLDDRFWLEHSKSSISYQFCKDCIGIVIKIFRLSGLSYVVKRDTSEHYISLAEEDELIGKHDKRCVMCETEHENEIRQSFIGWYGDTYGQINYENFCARRETKADSATTE